MDLWIRSQDKEKMLIVKEVFYVLQDNSIVCHLDGIPNILGKYETKERALEVLDEIQKKLMDFKVEFNDSGVTYKDVSVLIYEMPEV